MLIDKDELKDFAKSVVHLVILLLLTIVVYGMGTTFATLQEKVEDLEQQVTELTEEQFEVNQQLKELFTEELTESPKAKTVEEPKPTLSGLEAVENMVALEAKGESYEGQCLVAQCIKNRSELWGMSIEDVVNAPGQFASGYTNVTDSVKKAVNAVFNENYVVVDEPITHFHNPTVHPSWADSKTMVIREGNHFFYK